MAELVKGVNFDWPPPENPEKRDAIIETEGSRWWAEFIEHFAAKGVDRGDLNEAVGRFRKAQENLADAIHKVVR